MAAPPRRASPRETALTTPDWIEAFPAAITVCDEKGIITAMNERAAAGYARDGGRALIGKDVLDCHPEPAAAELRDLLANPRLNAYTIEKRGVKKLVYQAPWFKQGRFAGIVEMVVELPEGMPHFVRQP